MGGCCGTGTGCWKGDCGCRSYGIGEDEERPRALALALSRRRTTFLNAVQDPWSLKRLARRMRDCSYRDVEHIV